MRDCRLIMRTTWRASARCPARPRPVGRGPVGTHRMSSNDAYRSLVIVNPTSAAGATSRRWGSIAKLLQSSLGDFEHVITRAPGEATTLSRAVLRDGFEMVVSVGGEGPLNGVVGGFLVGSAPP